MMSDVDPELRRKYRAAFAKLPWMQREIFRLNAVEKLSYPEMAWLLGINVRTVERQLAKALYKIGKQMDGERLSWWERWF
jgi:RNA polymerase sigma-70 factor (ECF subfamily)